MCVSQIKPGVPMRPVCPQLPRLTVIQKTKDFYWIACFFDKGSVTLDTSPDDGIRHGLLRSDAQIGLAFRLHLIARKPEVLVPILLAELARIFQTLGIKALHNFVTFRNETFEFTGRTLEDLAIVAICQCFAHFLALTSFLQTLEQIRI